MESSTKKDVDGEGSRLRRTSKTVEDPTTDPKTITSQEPSRKIHFKNGFNEISRITSFFQESYISARRQFRMYAAEGCDSYQQLEINAKGFSGEDLTIDIARIGLKNPRNAVVLISGTHGVEGFLGSATQAAVLHKTSILSKDTSLYFIHGLNPYGMSHVRRVNENNVDLNRNNAIDEALWASVNEGYTKLYDFINPESPPSTIDDFFFKAKVGWKLFRHGMRSLQSAVTAGQYQFPKGLYYGGRVKEQSIKLLESFFKEEFQNTKKLYAVEIHTGLGPSGETTVFHDFPENDPRLSDLTNHFSSFYKIEHDKEGEVATPNLGGLQQGVQHILSNCEVSWLIQEVGTYDPITVFRALRKENRQHFYTDLTGKDLIKVKRDFLEAFVPQSEKWRIRAVKDGILMLEIGTNCFF